MPALKKGNKVPTFSTVDQNNDIISDESMLGQKYILFFYGQDDTPTCTKQVCSANDVLSAVLARNYQLFGVSPDKPKKHLTFINKYGLSISLLSDPNKTMMYAFGAYGPKVFMGKQVTGVYRKAFIVDEKGIIEYIIEDVISSKQGDQILDALKK